MTAPKRPRCRHCGATRLLQLEQLAGQCLDVRACGERVGTKRAISAACKRVAELPELGDEGGLVILADVLSAIRRKR